MSNNALIGKPVDRVDGRAKVTGGATYAAEFQVDNLAHAVLVMSTIASGRIREIDTRAALHASGVIEVVTHENAPRLPFNENRTVVDPKAGKVLHVLQSDEIYFSGQPIGVVVAETLEQAQYAAELVRVVYDEKPPVTSLESEMNHSFPPGGATGGTSRGDPDALKVAPMTIDATYTIPIEHHNAMEPHATIAVWAGGNLTLYDKTQWVANVREHFSLVFGMLEENIRVISHFVGGGFGSSLRPWAHPIIAAIAARMVNRPVKLVLTRRQMFSSHGHRPYTVQRVALGAAKDGKLTTIVHEVTAQTSIYEDYSESVLEPARVLYASPNCTTKYRLVRGNIQSPTPMRGPGESSGAHALECAMDELAYKVNIDPLELRMRNYAGADPDTGMPWSSKNLRECYLRGAEVFGWSRRKMEPRSMREGRFLLGMGMATGLYHTGRSAASARVRIFADGTAVVQSSASDMGPGTWTMMALVGAQALGLPIERVRSELGDTSLPKAPVHGGSITTASVGSAVHEACLAARAEILELAARDPGSPLHGATGDQVLFEGGRISLKYDPARAQTLSEILQRNQRDSVEATVESSPSEEAKKFSKQAFAAHFAEVRVDPELGVVRVSRFVCAASAGRIINEKIAHSQLVGGIVGGLGMALMEETVMDHRRGRFVNPTLAEYHVPVNADVPEIEAFFVEERDDVVNPLGAKGIAELSLVGVSAAIANAVYHATGKRVRKLPITLDKLL